MKVTALETKIIELPLPRPVKTAIHDMTSVGCVLVTVRAGDVFGEGICFTLNADRIRSFDEMVRGFESFVVGRDIHEIEGIWHDIWVAINPTGHKGVTIGALSAIDIALWDAVGKAADLPLHKLFGNCRYDVDTYASSGLWLSATEDELVDEAVAYVDQGFTAVKLRLGRSIDEDVARVRRVREAIGPDIALHTDANQGLSVKHAIRLGRRLEEFNLAWIEEPVAANDLVGHSEVRTALATPIASGETEYTRYGMQAMVDARSADILMPDLQRIGGFSEFRKASAIASAQHIPVSSHFFTEYSLSMAGSLHNCESVEHIDWFSGLFNEEMELVNGKLQIPNRPGTGFTFKTDL